MTVNYWLAVLASLALWAVIGAVALFARSEIESHLDRGRKR